MIEFKSVSEKQADALWLFLLKSNINFEVVKANDDFLRETEVIEEEQQNFIDIEDTDICVDYSSLANMLHLGEKIDLLNSNQKLLISKVNSLLSKEDK